MYVKPADRLDEALKALRSEAMLVGRIEVPARGRPGPFNTFQYRLDGVAQDAESPVWKIREPQDITPEALTEALPG